MGMPGVFFLAFIPCCAVPETIETYLFRISARSQAIYLIAAFMLIAVLVCLPFIYVDVTFSSPGMVTTMHENQLIVSPSNGKVVYARVRPDERVEAGDTLLVLDNSVLVARKRYLRERIMENRQFIGDLEQLTKVDSASIMGHGLNLKNPLYRASFQGFVKQYKHLQLEVHQKLANHERMERLFLNQAISSQDYETSRFHVEEALAGLSLMLANQLHIWVGTLSQKHIERSRLEAELTELKQEKKRSFLVSPFDGMVILGKDIQAGTFLFAGQQLGELSPEGLLTITTMVEPVHAGYLAIGQEVKVLVHAFNYQQWGTLHAVVMDVSDDAIIDPVSNRPFYRVRCRLLESTLMNRNGMTVRLKRGMTVHCRFVHSRKSIFTLVFRRVDQWMNPANTF